MIAVNETILKEYLKYKNTDKKLDKNLIQQFFQYYKPFVVSIRQLINIGYEEKTALLLYSNKEVFDKLSLRTSNIENEIDLINGTLFKVMLSDKKDNYPYINILDDNINKEFTTTYEYDKDRQKAKEHIKGKHQVNYI